MDQKAQLLRYLGRLLGLSLFVGALVLLGSFFRSPQQNEPDTLAPEPLALASNPRFVFWAFEGQRTTFFTALAEDPDQLQVITNVTHSEGYPPRASLSPNGRHIAFGLLPIGMPDRGDTAGLSLMDATTGAIQRLVERGVDIRQPPVWSSDGEWVAFRRTTMLDEEHYRFDVLAVRRDRPGEQRLLASGTSMEVLTIVPLGWGAEDTFYFVLVRPQGTEIWRTNSSGESKVATISEALAREVRLSPDGTKVAFVVAKGPGAATSAELGLLDLESGRVQPVFEGGPIFGPVWNSPAEELTYGVASSPGLSQPMGVRRHLLSGQELSPIAPPPLQGFDVPLAWEAAGRYLAVRAIEGSPDKIVGERVAIVLESSGERRSVQAPGWVEFIGWLP